MLSNRQQKMLLALIEKDDYINVEQFKGMFSISNRTVRHDLLILEEWLTSQEIGLERNRKYGVKLTLSTIQKDSLLKRLHQKPLYFSNEERLKLLKKYLLEQSILDTESLIDEFQISKNTFLHDYQTVRAWFQHHDLQVARKNGKLYIEGTEKDVRETYLELLREEFPTHKIFQLLVRGEGDVTVSTPWEKWFPLEEVYELSNILQVLEQKLNLVFSDSSFSALTLHILMAVQRLKEGHLIKMDNKLLSELQTTNEFQIVKNTLSPMLEELFNMATPKEEIGYITQHVLGAQREQENMEDDVLYLQLSTEVVQKMEQRIQRPLINRQKIIEGLAIHLKPAFYRAKYQLQSENPLLEQLENMYGSFMDMLEEELQTITSTYHFIFNRHEVSYIALHICSGLEQHIIPIKSKVAIVCSSGLGTSALLDRKLTMMYPQVTVTKKYSYKELQSLESMEEDFVLTTIEIPMSLRIPIVQVSPLLTKEDQQKLIPYIGEPRTNLQEEGKLLTVVNDVIGIMKQHGSIHKENKLMKDLLAYFQGKGNNRDKRKLSELLLSNSIQLQVTIKDWQTAIQLANDMLVVRGCTNEQFASSLIQMTNQPNNHFVIADGIAFPHANIDGEVFETGFSLITLKEPISFGQSKKDVWFIIMLGAVDQHQHTEALATLLNILNDKSFMGTLKVATDGEAVWRQICEKEGGA